MNITKLMKEKQKRNLLWGDNSFREEKYIWFVSCNIPVLYCLDLKDNTIIPIAHIPLENDNFWRQNSRCFKFKNSIWCLPDKGKKIYIYDLEECSWKSIEIDSFSPIGIVENWRFEERLYIVSREMKQIVELNLIREEIEGYYKLTQNDKERIGCSIKIGMYIYTVSSLIPTIIKFDCITKRIDILDLPYMDDELYTICFDGKRFWFTGRKKRIYIWDRDLNKLITLKTFPDGFGTYDFNKNSKEILDCTTEQYEQPGFLSMDCIGNNIWLIPWHTNEILYIDKETFKINKFSIMDELLTKDNINKQMLFQKYLFLYKWNDTIIGLFSLKNRWLIEIDCIKLNYKIIRYELSDDCILANNMISSTQSQSTFFENEIYLENMIYLVLNKTIGIKEKHNRIIGNEIYQIISKSL